MLGDKKARARRVALATAIALVSSGAAAAQAATISGVAFSDFNADGAQNTTSAFGTAVDTGLAGVTVTAFQGQGTTAATAVTAADGTYSLTVPAGATRVEFTNLPTGYRVTPHGTNNGTAVRFVSPTDAAPSTGVSVGAEVPEDFCANNPTVATCRFDFGGTGQNADRPAVETFAYTQAARDAVLTTIATKGQVGAVKGLTVDKTTGDVYVTAYMKRHIGFGPAGTAATRPGQIWRVPAAGAGFGAPVALGTIPAGTDPHDTANYDTDNLDQTFDAVGKLGLGDVEIAADGSELFVTNLFDRKLYRVPTRGANAGVEDAGTPIPAPAGCATADDWRPMGLGIKQGTIYVGGVCSQESTSTAGAGGNNTAASFDAYVLTFSPTSGTFSATPALTFPLRPADYPKKCAEQAGNANAQDNTNPASNCTGTAAVNNRKRAIWRAWVSAATLPTNVLAANDISVNYAQPMLSDIEFDGDSVILGMRDRWGDQMGNGTRGPVAGDATAYRVITAGDSIRACPATPGGVLQIENNGACGGVTGGGAGNAEGPGGGEFYNSDDVGNHDQIGFGEILQVPGFRSMGASAYDPAFGDSYDGGIVWSDNATNASGDVAGTRDTNIRLYEGTGDSSSAGFGKANGLGDLEAICRSAPLEIGNRVWLDTDADGVQDPGEAGIAGVTVQLLDAAGNPVPGVPNQTTDANGSYYFNVAPTTAYTVRIVRTQAALAAYGVSPTAAGGNTTRDSNGTLTGANDDAAVTTLTAGNNDHTLDFGFTPSTYDLALRKTRLPASTATVVPGQAVTFQLAVINQATGVGAAATNVQVTDYVPAGFRYVASDNTGAPWTPNANATGPISLTRTIAGPIAPNNASATTSIVLRVVDTRAAGALTNRAEISAFQGATGLAATDVDSTPDNNPNNDGPEVNDQVDGNGVPPNDQDDADLETVTVGSFDVALAKTTPATAVSAGQVVPFTLTVTNQSTNSVNDVDLADTIPTGYEYRATDNNGAASPWTLAGSTVTARIAGPIAANGTAALTLNLHVRDDAVAGQGFTNTAEITDFEDASNITPPDIDSTPGNGPGANEDDDDSVTTTLTRYDLALTKVTPAGRVANGAVVPFTITVTNQGGAGAIARNIAVTDYLPAGLTYNAADNTTVPFAWTAGPGANRLTATVPGPLAPGASVQLTVNLLVGASATEAQLINRAEISAFTDNAGLAVADGDSTPDTNPDNDTPGADDDIGGLNDSDDADPAPVFLNRYDLALTKKTDATTVVAGGSVLFSIDVFNQSPDAGSVAQNVVVTDTIPAGYTFTAAQNPGWLPATDAVGPAVRTRTIASFGPSPTPVTLPIRLGVAAGATNANLTNRAEISAFQNSAGGTSIDTDSTPDASTTNDGNEVDDAVNSQPPVDEDDSDPAAVTLAAFDLALTKTTPQTTAVTQGDVVPFTINVYNQAQNPAATATNVVVRDAVPAGYDFNTAAAANAGWTVVGGGAGLLTGPLTIERTIPSIAPSSTPTPLGLELIVNGAATTGNLRNVAQIWSFLNPLGGPAADLDSVPGSQPGSTNGGPPEDHAITGAGDTDDADGASVVASRFDLALRKTTTATTVAAGEVVPFTISVFNQSRDAAAVARNITVTDTIPAGFEYRAGDNPTFPWAPGTGANQRQLTIVGPLAPGDPPAQVTIFLHVLPGATNAGLTNLAEISQFTNTVGTVQGDLDSTPDADPANDGPFVDNEINGTPTSLPADEDDADPASVTLVAYDLALRKTTTVTAPVAPGDRVPFAITLFNQAQDARAVAQTVTVIDRIPAGFRFVAADNPGWLPATDVTGPAVRTFTTTAPLAANSTAPPVPIELRVASGAAFPGPLTNEAEISAFTNTAGGQPLDLDSTPDALPGDVVTDNEINSTPTGNPQDEDDADPASVVPARFDLALNKTSTATAVARGDQVTYTFNVVNQSPDAAATAAGIVVSDTIPAGLEYVAGQNAGNGWTQAGNTLTNTLAGTLAQGATRQLTLVLRVRGDAVAPSAGNPTLTNNAEITDFTDVLGGDQTDLDSTPNSGTDPNSVDDSLASGPGDEDDQDFEAVTLVGYDLALTKTAPAAPVVAGDDVTFTLTVTNQSTDAAAVARGIRVTDTVPAGYTFIAANQPAGTNWVASASGVAGQYDTTIAGPVAPNGGTATVQIVLRVAPGATNASLTNYGEITQFLNPAGTAETDTDSTPTFPPTDPAGEDDSDTASTTLVVYDLALAKTTSVTAPVAPGDPVPFTITVTNQATNARAVADTYRVVDTLPAGLTFDPAENPGWNAGPGANQVQQTVQTDLVPGTPQTLPILLRVAGGVAAPATLTNTAEIAAFTNPAGGQPIDVDSTPDANAANDGYDLANPDDNDITAPTVSEDDSDPASVTVAAFDLALIKTTTETAVAPGDVVPFVINVRNQSLDAAATAYAVQVTDTIPAGFDFRPGDNTGRGWSAGPGGNQVTTTLATPLAPGETRPVLIDLYVRTDATNAGLVNNAEISDFLDATGSNAQPDLDSTPDAIVGNDNDTGTDDNSYETTPGGSEDDSDPAAVTLAGFDLALQKTTTATRVAAGDVVPFKIDVFNQSTQARAVARGIQVTDTIPAGYEYRDADNPDFTWTQGPGANQRQFRIPGPLAPGLTPATVTINLHVLAGATEATLVNAAEISQFLNPALAPQGDTDSTPDAIAGNDGVPVDNELNNLNGDQDDQDIAPVTLARYDIELLKSTTVSRAAVGDPVDYTFTITNGANPATDPRAIIGGYTIVEDLPAGLSFSVADQPAGSNNGAIWSAAVNGRTTLTVPEDLAPGASTTRTIRLRVAPGALAANVLNNAEIGTFTDLAGGTPPDVDSTPGNGPSQNSVEDDDDFEQLTLAGFDLALQKTAPPTRVAAGDVVPFTIQVINQSADLRAGVTNIDIVDYVPVGLEFPDPAEGRNPGWVYDQVTRIARYRIPAIARNSTLAPAVTINLRVNPNAGEGALVNGAEIAGFQNENGQQQQDGDSTPDAIQINDAGGITQDNVVDQQPPVDEDDADPAALQLVRYDLGIQKTNVTPARVAAGDPVDFDIAVSNNANPATDAQAVARNVTVADAIPAGFRFVAADNPGWIPAADATGPLTVTRVLPGPIAPGASQTVRIRLRVLPDAVAADLRNVASITRFEDNGGGTPPDVNAANDQDDAQTNLARYDLALRKTVPTGLVAAGDLVPFTLDVINQSPDARAIARNVDITDTIPADMTFTAAENPGWTQVSATQVRFTLAGPIAANGGVATATLNLRVKAGATTAGLRNFGEISGFEDEAGGTPPDVDSVPDTDPTNDGTIKDDVVNEDYLTNPAANDSDDSDVATAGLARYDLALRKTSSDRIVAPGDAVTYALTVFNQSTDPRAVVQNIVITDAIPAGFSFDPGANPGWSVTGDGRIGRTIPGPLAPGVTTSVPLVLRVTTGAPDGANVNRAEIAAFNDLAGGSPPDVDSTPDTNLDNDQFVDDAISNEGGDQDDHDAATVQVARFDLALRKTAPAAPVRVFDAVDFTLTVFNQSTSPLGSASNIVVGDTIPAGFEFRAGDNPGWTLAGNRATFTITGPLAPGASQAIPLKLRVLRGATDQGLANIGEIGGFTDVNGIGHADVDSTPDADPGNDNLVDDAIDNQGGDQDDQDIARVVLAPPAPAGGTSPATAATGTTKITVKKTLLTKTLRAGRQATYRITAKNTGTKTAKAVVVCDVTSSELVYLSASRKATFRKGVPCFKVGDLKAGKSATITVRVRVTGDARGQVVNRATADGGNTKVASARASKRVVPKAQRAAGVTG